MDRCSQLEADFISDRIFLYVLPNCEDMMHDGLFAIAEYPVVL
jgi:hypothetical protein